MKAHTQVQLNLNFISDIIDEFLESIGANPTGIALVPIFGEGYESDNWEALYYFLDQQDGRVAANPNRLLQILSDRINTLSHLMRAPKLKAPSRKPHALYDRLSHRECERLAMGVVFLVEREVRRQKAYALAHSDGLTRLKHLNTWRRKATYEYCLSALVNSNIEFQNNPAWLLPLLANRFYSRSLIPWMQRQVS